MALRRSILAFAITVTMFSASNPVLACPQAFDDSFNNFSEWEALPQIDPNVIKVIEENKGVGLGYTRLERCLLNGAIVLRKVSRAHSSGKKTAGPGRSKAMVVKEANLYRILNRLTLGPRFHGVQMTEDGYYAIVTEFVEGTHFGGKGIEGEIPSYISPNIQSYIQDIRTTAELLAEAGIGVRDLQFLLTDEGQAIVIDPEEFSVTGIAPANIRHADRLINKLKSVIN